MKLTLELPEYDSPGHCERESDGYDYNPGLCALCGNELYGITVRLLPIGWLCAEVEEGGDPQTCQEKAVEKLLADPRAAWLTIAKHVAKYPSKHCASTVRAVITEMTKLAEGGAANA